VTDAGRERLFVLTAILSALVIVGAPAVLLLAWLW
jgi:hypothetical protein